MVNPKPGDSFTPLEYFAKKNFGRGSDGESRIGVVTAIEKHGWAKGEELAKAPTIVWCSKGEKVAQKKSQMGDLYWHTERRSAPRRIALSWTSSYEIGGRRGEERYIWYPALRAF